MDTCDLCSRPFTEKNPATQDHDHNIHPGAKHCRGCRRGRVHHGCNVAIAVVEQYRALDPRTLGDINGYLDHWTGTKRKTPHRNPRITGLEYFRDLLSLYDDRLTDRQREVMRLRFVEGLTVPAIAQKLGIGKYSVDLALLKGKGRLQRAHLEDQGALQKGAKC